jgi:hypothetical protein
MRQMWVEVLVKDMAGTTLAQSGELQDPSHDLCDADTLHDQLGPIVQGCDANLPDDQLVNFQTKLVDFVKLQNGVLIADPEKGHETWLQFQTGGAIHRIRPIDQQSLAPLKPFEKRTFHYTFTLAPQSQPITVGVTLKFRNLPPYFMRQLADKELGEPPTLKGLLSFEVIDMAQKLLTVSP